MKRNRGRRTRWYGADFVKPEVGTSDEALENNLLDHGFCIAWRGTEPPDVWSCARAKVSFVGRYRVRRELDKILKERR